VPGGQDRPITRALEVSLASGEITVQLPLTGDGVRLSRDSHFILTLSREGSVTHDLSSVRLRIRTASLCDTPSHARDLLWTGDHHVYFSLRAGDYYDYDPDHPPCSYGIWRLDARTGQLCQLTSVQREERQLLAASSDGKVLVTGDVRALCYSGRRIPAGVQEGQRFPKENEECGKLSRDIQVCMCHTGVRITPDSGHTLCRSSTISCWRNAWGGPLWTEYVQTLCLMSVQCRRFSVALGRNAGGQAVLTRTGSRARATGARSVQTGLAHCETHYWRFGFAHHAKALIDHPMVGKLGPNALDLSLEEFRVLLKGRVARSRCTCWTRPASPGSATSTCRRRCGGPGSTRCSRSRA
jgi:hypothetical protein